MVPSEKNPIAYGFDFKVFFFSFNFLNFSPSSLQLAEKNREIPAGVELRMHNLCLISLHFRQGGLLISEVHEKGRHGGDELENSWLWT